MIVGTIIGFVYMINGIIVDYSASYRPATYLKTDVRIKSGSGTNISPYILTQ